MGTMDKGWILPALLVATMLVCGTGIVSSLPGDKHEHHIRIALLGSPQDEDYAGALAFKHHLESRANEDIHVEIFPSSQFCTSVAECVDALRTGTLQVFQFTTGSLGSIYPPGEVLDLPYLFSDDDIAECVLDGPIREHLRAAILQSGLGIRLITASNTGGWRNFATTSRPITAPDDLRGLKIRTIASPIQQQLVRQLGANPTPVAWSEVYTALATGVVEGSKNSIQDILSMNLHEQIHYITLDGHAYMAGLWWYSEKSWQQLPPDLQKLVTAAFKELSAVTRAQVKDRDADAYRRFSAAGGSVIDISAESQTAFRDAASGVRNWYAQRFGTEWLARVDQAIAGCSR